MTSSTLSQQYAYALSSSEPSNYTTIPNILDHLTYDSIDEKTSLPIVKKLSVYACHLYRVIKNIAGQEGVSWRNTENLAELANMSTGKISECKKELSQKFHQLDGSPLITITEHDKKTFNEGGVINQTTYHKIMIENIWGYNRAFFLKKKWEKTGALSPHEDAPPPRSPRESAPQGAGSPGERNNITDNNTPLSKEQTTPPVSVCSFDKEYSVPSDSPETANEKAEPFNFLMKLGFDIRSATEILQSSSLEDLLKAKKYVEIQLHIKAKKNQTLGNIAGYFKKTLQNRWWEPKKT